MCSLTKTNAATVNVVSTITRFVPLKHHNKVSVQSDNKVQYLEQMSAVLDNLV